jgi:hypothetical protein
MFLAALVKAVETDTISGGVGIYSCVAVGYRVAVKVRLAVCFGRAGELLPVSLTATTIALQAHRLTS